MRIQDLPKPTRFMFWCTAPFLIATFVFLPLLAPPPLTIGKILLFVVLGLLEACVLLGLYDADRFKVCWRIAGGIVFAMYLVYLVAMIYTGQWLGDGRRAQSTAFNALIGLVVFGYPGFMYAVFGRFTWRPNPEGDSHMDDKEAEKEWKKQWDVRLAALEAEFGKSEDQIATSLIPIYLGGGADVVIFKHHIDGIVYVTAGLIGDGGQQEADLGEYELMMCARNETDWMPQLLSQLALYTFDAALNPGETMEISAAMPRGSTIVALLFLSYRQFKVDDIDAGVLLCIGLTEKEVKHCHANGHAHVLEQLKSKGVYPYTITDRESVI